MNTSTTPTTFPRHCLSMQSLTSTDIGRIFEKTDTLLDKHANLILPPSLLENKTVINLFFERSTRTRFSFELAAKRLGAYVLNFDAQTSSLNKGETLLDTIDNLAAMHVDLFIMRHSDMGACEKVATHLGQRVKVINAGDGVGEHPTQALLDMFTIRRYTADFSQLSVAIVGDIAHSRVAHSNIYALKTLGVRDIRLIGPSTLLPQEYSEAGVTLHHTILPGLEDVDVIILLRLQRERMSEALIPNATEYFNAYGLTQERLIHAKPGAIVMHPGPINRGVEIASDVAESSQSVILEQVKFGVAVRMAVMLELLQS